MTTANTYNTVHQHDGLTLAWLLNQMGLTDKETFICKDLNQYIVKIILWLQLVKCNHHMHTVQKLNTTYVYMQFSNTSIFSWNVSLSNHWAIKRDSSADSYNQSHVYLLLLTLDITHVCYMAWINCGPTNLQLIMLVGSVTASRCNRILVQLLHK